MAHEERVESEPAEHPAARARMALARAEGAQHQAEGAHPARPRARGARVGDGRAPGRGLAGHGGVPAAGQDDPRAPRRCRSRPRRARPCSTLLSISSCRRASGSASSGRTASARRRSCARSSPRPTRRAAASGRAGAPHVAAGAIVVGKNTRTAYLDQARAKLDDDKSIFDDVRGEGGGTVVNLGIRGMESMDLRSYLELFLFDGQKQRQKVGSLSGGERARVALAKVLREGANLLMFDEPTNDLDLPTLAALEEMLTGYEGSVLVVTHDRAFLDRVATAILAFEVDPSGSGPARVVRYAGGYEDYIAQRGDRRPRTAARRSGEAPEAPGGAADELRGEEERQGQQGRPDARRAGRARDDRRRGRCGRQARRGGRGAPGGSVAVFGARRRGRRSARPGSRPRARRPRASRSAGKPSKPGAEKRTTPSATRAAPEVDRSWASVVPRPRSRSEVRQFVTALLYVVVAVGAVTQNECAFPNGAIDVRGASGRHAEPRRADARGGTAVRVLRAGEGAGAHPSCTWPSRCRSDTMQSGSDVQVCVLHRCVVESHALPAAQSRSLLHLK